MTNSMRKFYDFLDRPMFPVARILLALLCITLGLSFTAPLWRISLEAPQYPEGLYMDVWAHTLEGGNGGQHLQEINTLNHYIGMHPISEEAIPDLDWMPFAIGILILLTLRAAAIGKVRDLIDITVLSIYVLGFMGARFVYRLYVYGHDLAPDAPVTVEPFMPPVLGTKQIANFTSHSWPQLGSLWLAVFLVGCMGVALWHLVRGRRAAQRAEEETPHEMQDYEPLEA